MKLGYDGLYIPQYYDSYGAFVSPSQFKAADAITYDNNNNIIPIVKRDNFHNLDRRYEQGGVLKAQKGRIVSKVVKQATTKTIDAIPYKSVIRSSDPTSPLRSTPIIDIFRFQIPSFKTGDLGRGHYYRAIGNNSGLSSAIKNGIISKNPTYNKYDAVHWAKDEPLREYTTNSALMVSYDKDGPYVFGVGNFDNPISGASNPISLFDPNVKLYGRYPFMSKYHIIPKTEEGFKHANTLGYLNRFVEKPIRLIGKGTLGYLGYKALKDDSENDN